MPVYRFYIVFLKGQRPDCFWIVNDEGFGECYRLRLTPSGRVELYATEIPAVTEIPSYQAHEYFEAVDMFGLRDLLDIIEELIQEINQSDDPSDKVTRDLLSVAISDFFRARHADRVNQ